MRLPRYIYWETIFEYGADIAVSTLTVLLSFTDIGSEFADICIFLDNRDPDDDVYLVVEVSHGGTHPCDSGAQTKIVSPGTEDFVQLSYPNPFTSIRISARTASPSFPAATVKWAIIGLRR